MPQPPDRGLSSPITHDIIARGRRLQQHDEPDRIPEPDDRPSPRAQWDEVRGVWLEWDEEAGAWEAITAPDVSHRTTEPAAGGRTTDTDTAPDADADLATLPPGDRSLDDIE